MKILALVLLFSIVGCQAEVTEEDKNKLITCIDTRDQETFEFNSSDMTDIVGNSLTGDYSFDVVDADGNKRHFTKQSELYTKCKNKGKADE